VTLGGAKDAQRYEDFGVDLDEFFYLHYTFQGYSVGECKPYRGVGRREIGHGVLAERALRAVIPPKEKFPYTIRVTSDILESNGSSSMATVCAGSLALMDAGVPIKSGVSGIAMGLIQENARVAILSDILGMEDALGDMDFKVAGPRDRITSFQMDIKIEGLTFEVMEKALYQAMTGKNKILDEMEKSLKFPRALSPNAPRIYNIKVQQDKIGTVIGPGGKMIRSLTEKYGVTIDIAEDGMVSVQGEDSTKADSCLEEIAALTSEIEVGKVYKGTVKSIKDFGAFVECIPGKDGLLHISRISTQRINKVTDVLQMGQSIEVKCIGIDEKGRVVLSHVDLFDEPAKI
jgi:polyribonucleotide nucleotidyltransferase